MTGNPLLFAIAFLMVALLAATALVALADRGRNALLGAARTVGALALVVMYFVAIGRLL